MTFNVCSTFQRLEVLYRGTISGASSFYKRKVTRDELDSMKIESGLLISLLLSLGPGMDSGASLVTTLTIDGQPR